MAARVTHRPRTGRHAERDRGGRPADRSVRASIGPAQRGPPALLFAQSGGKYNLNRPDVDGQLVAPSVWRERRTVGGGQLLLDRPNDQPRARNEILSPAYLRSYLYATFAMSTSNVSSRIDMNTLATSTFPNLCELELFDFLTFLPQGQSMSRSCHYVYFVYFV